MRRNAKAGVSVKLTLAVGVKVGVDDTVADGGGSNEKLCQPLNSPIGKYVCHPDELST